MNILHYTSHFLFAIMFCMYILTNPISLPFLEQWSQGGISHLNMCEQFSQLKSYVLNYWSFNRSIIVIDN